MPGCIGSQAIQMLQEMNMQTQPRDYSNTAQTPVISTDWQISVSSRPLEICNQNLNLESSLSKIRSRNYPCKVNYQPQLCNPLLFNGIGDKLYNVHIPFDGMPQCFSNLFGKCLNWWQFPPVRKILFTGNRPSKQNVIQETDLTNKIFKVCTTCKRVS